MSPKNENPLMADKGATASNPSPTVQESSHLMELTEGLFCIYHGGGSGAPDPATGYPAARLSLLPGPPELEVSLVGFDEGGWMVSLDSAAMIRVLRGPAQVMLTTYQAPNCTRPPPLLQITRLSGVAPSHEALVPGAAAPTPNVVATRPGIPEVLAHCHAVGDVVASLGQWIGERGGRRWIEGFSLAPSKNGLTPGDVEYQAVLGRSWLTPWMDGGQYCGTRELGLPILGLRVRLRGEAAGSYSLKTTASFVDGEMVGPLGSEAPCQSQRLSPLEAFCVEIRPLSAATASKTRPSKTASAKPGSARAAPKPK